MTKSRKYVIAIAIIVLSVMGVSMYFFHNGRVLIEESIQVKRLPKIWPDYSGIVIPPNIAPLNFKVCEDGEYYFIKVYSEKGEAIEIYGRSPKITICPKSWGHLLQMNRGNQLYFDVFVKSKDGQWNQFATIVNKITEEEIDNFIAYRKITPAHGKWSRMGIYQRNLEDFEEVPILHNWVFKQGCVNCHSYNNEGNKMLIGIRSGKYGSSALLIEDGKPYKIDTKFGYTSWHPSGRLAVYSVNKVRQFFRSVPDEIRDVIDLDSFLAYYVVGKREVKTFPQTSLKGRLETYPTWSPDGKYLYFCSAPLLWSRENIIYPEKYEQVKYDLVRVSYDIEKDECGEIETILAAEDTNLSILEPRISPDGRWLLFVMCNYGCFPVYQKSSDLYIMDVKAAEQTGKYEYKRLVINSDRSESWHSWSSNSRWIAFSSKRDYGVFTRIYFSYVDEQGKVCKPFIMPQKDPEFYDSCLFTFSVPELVNNPVKINSEKLGKVIRGKNKISVKMPLTMATPQAEGLPDHTEPWQQR